MLKETDKVQTIVLDPQPDENAIGACVSHQSKIESICCETNTEYRARVVDTCSVEFTIPNLVVNRCVELGN